MLKIVQYIYIYIGGESKFIVAFEFLFSFVIRNNGEK